MMEVFISFSTGTDVRELEATMNAWDLHMEAEVVGIKVPAGRYQTYRRLSAEMLARGNYIIADIGCVPVESNFIEYAEQYLNKHKKIGMVRAEPGHGVDICRKGIIQKWPIRETATYNEEHKKAYELEGYQVSICDKLHYRRIEAPA